MATVARREIETSGAGDDVIAIEPLPLIHSERRLSLRAYHYWRARLNERALPRLDDCTDLLATSFAGHMLLLDLPGGGREREVRQVGHAFATELGIESEGVGERLIAELVRRLPALALQRAPIGFEAELPEEGSGAISFRGILLPLADADDRLAHVMGVMSWRHSAEPAAAADIVGALATVGLGTEAAPAVSVWDQPADAVGASDPSDLFAAAATWAGLARLEAARMRSHLHRAIGLIHDAACDVLPAELAVSIDGIVGDLVPAGERSLLIDALAHARRIGLTGKRLTALLDADPSGLAGFLARPVQVAGEIFAAEMPAVGFRLTPLDPSFLAPVDRREASMVPQQAIRRIG